jgi:hypothetical protein
MTIARIDARRRPAASPARGFVGYLPLGEAASDSHDDPNAAQSETLLAVLVSGAARDNVFHSMFRSRWLADLKLIDAGLNLPLLQSQLQSLRDYRELLLTALGWDDDLKPTVCGRGVVRQFLVHIKDSHHRDIGDIVGQERMSRLDIDERSKFANVWALFRSVAPARSLTEALGFTIVMASLPA